MVVVVWVIGVVVAVAVVGAVVLAQVRRRQATVAETSPERVADVAPTGRPRPVLDEFHSREDTAHVYFMVPLPEGDSDPVLRDVVLHEAVEVLKEKKSHGLPLDHVRRVTAYGVRGSERPVIGTIDLETPGVLPELALPELVPHASKSRFDVVDQMSEGTGTPPGIADSSLEETLPPLSKHVQLTDPLNAGLRSLGVDPDSMSAGQLVLGLLRLSGYQIDESAGGAIARRAGSRIFVTVVDHERGSYPELDEASVNKFMVDFVSSGMDRGLLVTEKYGPFLVYDKERRESRVRFLTRERLQDFVDAIAVS